MRRVDNPPNPFVAEHREWLEEPPQVRLEVYEEQAKSILSENDSPDLPFRWGVNPYRGCQHACAYCYARPTHEYLGFGAGTDFESRLVVKVNAPELLRKALSKPGWSRETLTFSGVTDCYQPLEAVYRLTRSCLEVCRDFANPAAIVTKSFQIVRDVELLLQLRRRTRVHVLISIPFADAESARLIEPGAPPPARRLEAVRRLAEAGLPVGVMIAPLIPGLNDREIPAILERAAEAGAQSAHYQALRLPGSVQDVFLARLRAVLPDAAGRVEARIRDMRGGRLNDARFGSRMRGSGIYWESIQRLFETMATRYGLDGGQRWRRRAEASPSAQRANGADDRPPRHGVQLPLFDGRPPPSLLA